MSRSRVSRSSGLLIREPDAATSRSDRAAVNDPGTQGGRRAVRLPAVADPGDVTAAEVQAYYEPWALKIGQRDWLLPNLRHEKLKILIAQFLGDRCDLRIADVGCATGVMSAFLSRYGRVVAVDLSTAAIEFARSVAPHVEFHAGGLEAVPAGTYDLITLFDVLEHIPAAKRPEFLGQLRGLLADDGLLFCSTPYPENTKQRLETGFADLQIVDEQVELAVMIGEVNAVGLQLIGYEAYDVWRGSPEYQAMVLSPTRQPDGPAVLVSPAFTRRRRLASRRELRWARRFWLAGQAALHGRPRIAWWFLSTRAPDVRS
jgi:SAM-dependent methyltransferase